VKQNEWVWSNSVNVSDRGNTLCSKKNLYNFHCLQQNIPHVVSWVWNRALAVNSCVPRRCVLLLEYLVLFQMIRINVTALGTFTLEYALDFAVGYMFRQFLPFWNTDQYQNFLNVFRQLILTSETNVTYPRFYRNLLFEWFQASAAV
jgi:hypothetical protein